MANRMANRYGARLGQCALRHWDSLPQRPENNCTHSLLGDPVPTKVENIFSQCVSRLLEDARCLQKIVAKTSFENLWDILHYDRIWAEILTEPGESYCEIISWVITVVLFSVRAKALAWRTTNEDQWAHLVEGDNSQEF
jgi:hypothetical protein